MSGSPLKPFLATAKGGAILTGEIIAIEPSLCKDQRWRPVAITHAGAKVELSPEALEFEEIRQVCLMLVEMLVRYRRWNVEDAQYAMGR